jgi:hypothetical protein
MRSTLASVERKLASFVNLDSLKDASAGSERRSGAARAPTVQMLSRSEQQFTDVARAAASRAGGNCCGGGEFEYTTVAMDDLLSVEEKVQVSSLLAAGAADAATTTSSASSLYRGWSGVHSATCSRPGNTALGSAAAALSSLASGGKSLMPKDAAESAAHGRPSSQRGAKKAKKRSGSGGYLGFLSKLAQPQQAQAEQQQHRRPGGAAPAKSTPEEIAAIERSLLDGRRGSGRRRVALAAAFSALILFIVFCVRVRIASGHFVIDISLNS